MLKVIRGEDKKFTATFSKETCDGVRGDPIDLTAVDEITFLFPSASGGPQSITLGNAEITILSAVLGKVEATINDTKSALLKVGEEQTFEASIEFGTDKKKVIFEAQLTVVASLG